MRVVHAYGHAPDAMTSSATEPERNGYPGLDAAPAAYLLKRGFTPSVIQEVGWRIEPLGPRCRHYGLPAEAQRQSGGSSPTATATGMPASSGSG